jgi:hypothetical protein
MSFNNNPRYLSFDVREECSCMVLLSTNQRKCYMPFCRHYGMERSHQRAKAAFLAVVAFLQHTGCPKILTFDRDPRRVGSATARDFPSALCQILLCVGVQPNILPPRRPDLNAYVERYHRTSKEECLQVSGPGTLQEVRTVTKRLCSMTVHCIGPRISYKVSHRHLLLD